MKKSVVLVIAIAFIAAGAFVMSYAVDWTLDLIGFCLMAGGAGVSTFFIVKNKDGKKRWIASLVCTWLGVVILTVAGLVQFKGTIIIALAGACFIAAYAVIEYKRLL